MHQPLKRIILMMMVTVRIIMMIDDDGDDDDGLPFVLLSANQDFLLVELCLHCTAQPPEHKIEEEE